ncbi:MAG: TspO/MBR family protein [Dehalococcoidia bacterium]
MHWLRYLRAPVAFLALSLFPSVLTARTTRDAVDDWYRCIHKPAWNPPPWLFGPVWTALYVLIAIAGTLLWRRRDDRGARLALTLWGVQMALNHAWSPIFFGWRRLGLAAVEVSTLWASILATVAAARRVSVVAAAMLLPYLAWVTFAAALNLRVWALNRGGSSDASDAARRAT